jgi:hypothetical protein
LPTIPFSIGENLFINKVKVLGLRRPDKLEHPALARFFSLGETPDLNSEITLRGRA